MTKEEFVAKSEAKHGVGTYGYDRVPNIVGSHQIVEIFCPKHGYFSQMATLHCTRGHGCRKCYNENTHTRLQGQARRDLRKKLFGVALFDMDATCNGEIELIYRAWKSMIVRCYSESYQKKEPTYKGCEVCEEWLLFSNFYEWANKNGFRESYHLDKDIISKGNKIYSPLTCCFVPIEINSLFTKNNSKRGDVPIGVRKRGKRYTAYCSFGILRKDAKRKVIGTFDTPEQAFTAYKQAKEIYIKEVAQKYYDEGKIIKRVYDALLNYKIDIND